MAKTKHAEKNADTITAKDGKRFWKRWWFWVIVVLVIAAIGGATGAGNGTGTGAGQTQNANTATDAQQQPAEPQQEPTGSDATPDDGETTSGGIGYGDAVVACDNAAREQLFPGSAYESSPLLGKQKGQVGIDDAQYLAAYNVTVDGRHTAITCLVDGTKDNVNVISINETEAR